MRIAAKVELSEAQRKQLETWATGRTIPVRLAERAKMILLAAQGKTDKEIGADLRIWRGTVARWRGRFGRSSLRAGIRALPSCFKRRPCAGRHLLFFAAAKKSRQKKAANTANSCVCLRAPNGSYASHGSAFG